MSLKNLKAESSSGRPSRNCIFAHAALAPPASPRPPRRAPSAGNRETPKSPPSSGLRAEPLGGSVCLCLEGVVARPRWTPRSRGSGHTRRCLRRPTPPSVCYHDDRGAQMPSTSSSYLIVPMSRQPAQVGVPTPSAPHPVGGRPQQVLNVQAEVFIPQPSPPSAGRKVAASPKIQTLKSLPSQSSAGNRFIHKESLPGKDHPQAQSSSDSVRSKFRETLPAAFSTDPPDHQVGQQQPAANVPLGLKVLSSPSESMSQPNPKRARMSDVHPGVKPVSQVGPESRRAITADETTEDLPEIMTLDEFMQVLHSEPHPEDQSARAMQDDPSFDKADKALKSESFLIAKDKAAALKFQFHSDLQSAQDNFEAKLESSMKKSVSIMDPVLEPKGDVIVKSRPEKVDTKKPDTANGSIPESSMQCKITPDAALTYDRIWEATIQLSLTSLTSIVAIFKSGEKTSTAEWRRFLEIKGRVRLSVFKEFIEQLPNSRSRAIMVTELCLKEGSLESGRHHLLQTIDSYIADGRVGLVNPAEGVEIYLCPQREAVKILADHLPKQHSSSLIVTETSIIGLVVWWRPHVSPKVLPNGQDVPKSRAMIPSSIVPRISQPPSCSSNACRSAHGLPGSGPGVVKDDDDDLPEHNLVSVSNSALNATTSQTDRSHRHASLSEYRAREMIRKYGTEPVVAQPWNGDGDEFASMRATVPVQRPLTYGHLMRPTQQSCYGVPDDIGYCSGSWNQGLMAWNLW